MNQIQPTTLAVVRDQQEALELKSLKWGEPKPLNRDEDEPPVPPIDHLGPTYGPIVRKISEVIQAPLALAMNSVLSAGSLAVQAHGDVVNDGRVHPSSLMIFTVGSSGERKSEIDKVAMKAHKDKRDKENEGYQAAFQSYLADELSFKKTRDDLVSKHKKAGREELTRKIEGIGPAPVPPLTPSFLLNDVTVEGIYRSLSTGQPSQGLFSAEGATFLNGHAMSDENRLRTAATISLLWDGAPIDRHRAGEGSSVLIGRRLALHLMVQRRVASTFLSDPTLEDQGLLSRMLVSAPSSTIGFRPYIEENIFESVEFQRYHNTMTAIIETDVVIDKNGGVNPPKLPLKPDAKRIWIAFHNAVEEEMRPGGKYFTIRGLAAKAPEHALRIAANLALVYNLQGCKSIDAETLISAIELTDYYLNEALRLFGSPAIDPELAQAQLLLDWMHAQKKQTFALTEIYQKGPVSLRNVRLSRECCSVLIEHGWIQPLQNGLIDDGGVHRREGFALRPIDV